MSTIKITCENCHTSHEVHRDENAPKTAISMGCNWCPACEGDADDYYKDWYNFREPGERKSPIIPIADNQLCLPFGLAGIEGVKWGRLSASTTPFITID